MSKKEWWSKLFHVLLLNLVGFCIGCIYLNLLWKWGGYALRNAELIALDEEVASIFTTKEQFLFCVGASGILFLLLYLSGFGKIGLPFAQGINLCLGILNGSFVTLYLLSEGLKGVNGVLISAFPQMLLLAPAFFLSIVWCCNMSTKVGNYEKEHSAISYRKYTFYMFVFFIIFTGGLFLKYYVNPIFLSFLKKI